MDISMNMIDLEYLINPAFANLRANLEENDNLKSDIEFYKKRIFKLTKDLLRNISITTQVDEGFREYARICIKYFKFIDKSDIIQKQYDHHKKRKPKSVVPNKVFPDHLLMKGVRGFRGTIPECIPVKIKNEKKKIVFMPQSHDINLKDPAFKIKGLGKKNMHNKYEKDKKKRVKKKREGEKEK